jgi:uncharacterized protein (DUF302 family)
MSSEVTITEREFRGVRVDIGTPTSFDSVLSRLRDLCGKATVPELVELSKEDISEQDYANEVERRFVGESGFMLFNEIDHGGWIAKFGIHRRSIRLILGNPLIAITMIRHDISAGLFAPVELLVTEREDGAGCVLTYVRPSSLISIDDNVDLNIAARALDRKYESLITHALEKQFDVL